MTEEEEIYPGDKFIKIYVTERKDKKYDSIVIERKTIRRLHKFQMSPPAVETVDGKVIKRSEFLEEYTPLPPAQLCLFQDPLPVLQELSTLYDVNYSGVLELSNEGQILRKGKNIYKDSYVRPKSRGRFILSPLNPACQTMYPSELAEIEHWKQNQYQEEDKEYPGIKINENLGYSYDLGYYNPKTGKKV